MDEKNRDSPGETENQVEDTSRYGVHIKRNRAKYKKEQEYEPKRKAKASQATSGSFYDEAAVFDGGIPERRKGKAGEKSDVKIKTGKTGIVEKKEGKGKEGRESKKKRGSSSLYFDPVGDTVRKQIHEGAKEDTGAESVDDVVIAVEYTGRVVSVVADGVEAGKGILFKNRKYDTKDVEHPDIDADDEGGSGSKYRDYKGIPDKNIEDVSKYDPDKHLERKSNGALDDTYEHAFHTRSDKTSYKDGEKISLSNADENRKPVSGSNMNGDFGDTLSGSADDDLKYAKKYSEQRSSKAYSEKLEGQQSRYQKNAGNKYQSKTFEDTEINLKSGTGNNGVDAVVSKHLKERQIVVTSQKRESLRNKYKSRILDETNDAAALKNREKSLSSRFESGLGSSLDSNSDGSSYESSRDLSFEKYSVSVDDSGTHTISGSKVIQENEAVKYKSFDRKYDDAIVKSRFDETGEKQVRRNIKSKGKIAEISDVPDIAEKGYVRVAYKKLADSDIINISKRDISQIEEKADLVNVAYKSEVTAKGEPAIRSYKDIDSDGNSVKIRHNKAENRLDDVS